MMSQVMNTIFVVIFVGMLSLGVAAFVLHFTSCNCKSSYNSLQSGALHDMVLGMPGCSPTKTWATCLGGPGDIKQCINVYEGNMPDDNKNEGCWIKDKDNDPCLHFSEGGPSPDMVPKGCASLCCSGGHIVYKE